MKKLFICLANSRKYTQRCVAGIELVKSSRKGYRYQIVKQDDDNPIWIRPVSSSEHGEVSSELVDHIKLLDIVEVNVTGAIPQGYQSENVLFDNHRLEVVERIDKLETLVEKLLGVNKPDLFGNKERAVHVDDIDQVNYSLVLIKPAYVEIFETTSSKGNPQIRSRFVYEGASYDLPITDFEFEEKFRQNPDLLQTCTNIYFTISLGVVFNDWHYKLIAGVICF
jgi:hypothetical protein